MPVDPTGLFDALMTGLNQIPSAIIAAALIAGPTLIWIIARFLNPPDPASTGNEALEELLWVCANCRSINEDRIASCYRCQRPRIGKAAPVVNEDEETETAPGVGVAVGPGLPLPAPDTAWIEREVARASDSADDALPPEEDLVAAELASLTFEPVILEPRVTASGRPGAAEPAARRARRKPPGSGESKPKRARKTGSG